MLDYIRQSIEIIMNLKTEETPRGGNGPDEALSMTCTSVGSVGSDNLIMVSMKDAVVAMNEKARRHKGEQHYHYERQLQKLEGDIRGHFKVSFRWLTVTQLEHEMKIHMDYLEGKIEQLAAQLDEQQEISDALEKKALTAQDKIKMIKEAKDREVKELNRKLAESREKCKAFEVRIQEVVSAVPDKGAK